MIRILPGLCPKCQKTWPEDLGVCPEDGTALCADSSGNGSGSAQAATALALEADEDEDDEADYLKPGTKIGEFEVQGKIGVGGMAVVYSAIHSVIGKRAAIKVISPALSSHPGLVDRFIQEARAVNEIQHRNVVDVFSIGTLEDGRCYLVMEWLSGENLGERLARDPIPIGEAADILDQICEALQAAHAKKIWHRDLKPDNLFLVPIEDRLQVKLLDFGIAKLSDTQNVAKSQTRTGTVMGTPDYMSPEQARGLPLDGATDIYSLGVVAFEMLTGRLPFEADNPADVLVKHLCEPPPAPSSVVNGIPPELDSFVTRLLAKERNQRPGLDEFRALLSEVYRNALANAGGTAKSALPISVLRRRIMTPVPDDEKSVDLPASMKATTIGKKRESEGIDPTLLVAPLAASSTVAPADEPRRISFARAFRLALPLFVLGLLGGIAAMLLMPDARAKVENALGLPDAGPEVGAEGPAEDLGLDEPDEDLASEDSKASEKVEAKEAAREQEPPEVQGAIKTPDPAAKSRAPAFLSIKTNVPAKIFVDGDLKVRSARQARVKVTPGRMHTIKLLAPMRRTIVRKVKVAPGNTEMVKVVMQKVGSKKRRRR